MNLSVEEKAFLDGDKGPVMKKITETVVRYGEAFGADGLVNITAPGHLVMSAGVGALTPFYEMLDEIIEAEHFISFPFTVDPRPYDDMKGFNFIERLLSKILFSAQSELEEKLTILGIKNNDAYTCGCYLSEVGNIPQMGDVLSWAESSAVVYANSVLGARTNRNSGGIDILCNILGKTPYFGLLTDEGRMADILVELQTNILPDPQLLGTAIGLKVQEKVPYIVGLDKYFLDLELDEIRDYLKDMGAASAASGAVGLFHVDDFTPEAQSFGKKLLKDNCEKYIISDDVLVETKNTFTLNWYKKPQLCLIGCPHLSYKQVVIWSNELIEALNNLGKKAVNIKTFISTAPDIIKKMKEDNSDLYNNIIKKGVFLTPFCPLAVLNNPLIGKKRIITNSGKLRNYSSAQFFEKEKLLAIITGNNIELGE